MDILLLIWATVLYEQHTPQEDNFGRTCDERGCPICNLSDPAEFLDYIKNQNPERLPDSEEISDAVADFLATHLDS